MSERRMIQLEDMAIAWWMVFVYGFTAMAGDLSVRESWIIFCVLCGVYAWAGFSTCIYLLNRR